MDFINKQYIASTQVGEDGGKVTSTLDRRACCHFHIDAHFVSEYMREGRLAQARRAIEQDMIQGFMAFSRRRHQDSQILLDLILPDQVAELLWTQGIIDAIIGLGFRV